MKAYLIKYCLSGKIEVGEGEEKNGETFSFSKRQYDYFHRRTSGMPDYALNEDDALAIAEKMRIKRIASLKRQIEKLQSLKFKITEMK